MSLRRQTDTARSAWSIVTILVGCAAVLFLVMQRSDDALAIESDTLEVKIESGGGVRATARVLFSAKPEVIQGLLTDYAHWPDLFEVRMRIADVTVENDIVTVDLRIDHALMPGERRLVTESRALPGGRVVTDLKGGDFKRYHRVWLLQPSAEGDQTIADFELVVQPDLMVPDWLIAMVTRQELEAHFQIIKHKASELARSSSRSNPS